MSRSRVLRKLRSRACGRLEANRLRLPQPSLGATFDQPRIIMQNLALHAIDSRRGTPYYCTNKPHIFKDESVLPYRLCFHIFLRLRKLPVRGASLTLPLGGHRGANQTETNQTETKSATRAPFAFGSTCGQLLRRIACRAIAVAPSSQTWLATEKNISHSGKPGPLQRV